MSLAASVSPTSRHGIQPTDCPLSVSSPANKIGREVAQRWSVERRMLLHLPEVKRGGDAWPDAHGRKAWLTLRAEAEP
jgi:hypothetical protein